MIAPHTPADHFDAALEAARFALTCHTPVFVLSDGYLANRSEPCHIPDVAELSHPGVEFATAPNRPDGSFWPYLRDPETLARPWVLPGTPGLEHGIGGIQLPITIHVWPRQR